MGITVRQALDVPALREAKVVAGHGGLDNVISFVNIMEVPEVTKWMKGGELLVTAGFAISDSSVERRRLIYDLATKGVAAFGIKLGQYFQSIPDDIIEYANEVGMPLIELPHNVPYMDFMVPIFEIMIGDQLARLKKSEEIHNRLLEIVLNGNGLPTVCQTLVELAGNPVLVIDARGNMLASAWPPSIAGHEHLEEKVLGGLEKEKCNLFSINPLRQHRFSLKGENNDQSLVAVRIDISDSLYGLLIIIETNRVLDNQDVMAMENASTIIALEFLKQKIVHETEKQIRVELLEDLISGNFRFEKDVIRRADLLNFSLTKETVIFVVSIDEGGGNRRTASLEHHLKNELTQFIQYFFRDFSCGVLLLARGDNIIGLVCISSSADMISLQGKLVQLNDLILEKWPEVNLSVGVGRKAETIRLIQKSYEEALDALRIAGFMKKDAGITFFDDLGVYSFLFELKDSLIMGDFFERTIGRVITHDRQNSGELLKTLIYYFQSDCNLRVTAERLYIHKNTVLYRIRKIEQITQLSMTNPEHRFNLQLGLKLRQVLKDKAN
ncbi:MAG: PucR family transcriptional regulator ligand-binding domain-containing protein [Peptococcaceae bacterium]|nr:PucR family transcriptional regulator ligand-binding domain-containing protein [Peptococcaceae bacterium]